MNLKHPVYDDGDDDYKNPAREERNQFDFNKSVLEILDRQSQNAKIFEKELEYLSLE